MTSKSILRSKTFWFNIGAIVTTALLEHGADLKLDPTTSILVLGILNLVNRLFTSKSVHIV